MLLILGGLFIVFFIAVYAVVIRGSLGLVKKRLDDEPELLDGESVPDDQLPTDVTY